MVHEIFLVDSFVRRRRSEDWSGVVLFGDVTCWGIRFDGIE